ncbi:hypothetical protein KSD_49240 [Ktedonobacter sp. SOSP1-85]|uniref:variant leucine-rich repeat-containing protein n=1 Tax=Ktedonobacter sp. SOSP1-85 TaxID=2778367 RepID=UPI0019153AFE|nr:hypothetical protein [Ktedonobacter sp. SOSP1-85]GHO77153.1 hypothetical protein KSD_49240 [Ktedonobacter sp. SOSP1-85]
MRHHRKKHPYAGEAANPETAPARLAELAQERELKHIIAANPNAPSNLLEAFALDQNDVVRRATTQNPNTPLTQLLKLIEEFPHEFLCNPLLPLLNLAQPDFIKKASPKAWLQLLRCAEIPQHWLQWFQQGHVMIASYVKEHVMISYNAHISVAGEITSPEELQKSHLNIFQPRQPLDRGLPEHESLILTTMVLPDLAKHWLRQGEFNKHVERLITLIYHNQNIDEDVLRGLAQHKEVRVRQAVARHPRTSDEVLLRLLQDKKLEVRYSLIKRTHMSSTLLAHLVASSDPYLRQAAVRHPQLEEHILEKLARDTDVIVRTAVAARHGLSEQIYSQLAQDKYDQVRIALARNVKTPQHVLLSLARDKEEVVRQAAAQNPTLPEKAFFQLAEDPDDDILAKLAGNSQLPRELFVRFVEHPEIRVRKKLAANPRIPLELLDQLWHDLDLWEGIARNSNATPEMLTTIAASGNLRLKAICARHKRTPVLVLQKLAEEGHTVGSLVRNPHTPLETLEGILGRVSIQSFNQKPAFFLESILDHPAVSKKRRTQMLQNYYMKELRSSTSDWIRPKLLAYEKLPMQFLSIFARSPIPIERYQSAQHPNASTALLKELAQDANRYVRAAARQQLALREKKK